MLANEATERRSVSALAGALATGGPTGPLGAMDTRAIQVSGHTVTRA
jgi:hypothetical protein